MYERSGLFAKNNNQEGAIPVLLALQTLSRVLDSREMIYTTGRNLRIGSERAETDLVVVSIDRRGELELGIGEVKDEGGEIDDDDIRKLVAVRERIVATVQNCFLIFAKAADNFMPLEIARFQKVVKTGTPLVLLTNRELEPYHP